MRYIPGEKPDTDYPFSMVVRDILQHSGSMSTRSKALDLVVSGPFIEINDKDAERLGILDNSHVKVSSKRGSVYLRAKLTDEVPEGAVFTSAHFPHGRINAMTHIPLNGGVAVDAVKVEAVK